MPNLAQTLKSEIIRVARKEIRAQTEDLKKSLAGARAEIRELKARLQANEKLVRQQQPKATAPRKADVLEAGAQQSSAEPQRLRFSAPELGGLRKRLGLSQAEFAKLVGVSSLSIYKWETGQVRPRDRYLQSIAAVRKLSKDEVVARLQAS